MSRSQQSAPQSPSGRASPISLDEQDRIIRNYFLLVAEEEDSWCPHCGEPLRFQLHYGQQGGRVRVQCPDCGSGFEWEQTRPPRPFKALHLKYFLQRHGNGQPLRCPIDDSAITAMEFCDGVLEFRCPYCNRHGRTGQSDSSDPRIGNQLLQLT